MGLKIWQVGCWNFKQNESWNCANKDDVLTNILLFCEVIWFQKVHVNLTAFNFDYYFQWKIIPQHLVVNRGFLFWFLIFWQMQLTVLLLQLAAVGQNRRKHMKCILLTYQSIHFPERMENKSIKYSPFGQRNVPEMRAPHRVAGLPSFWIYLTCNPAAVDHKDS